MCVSGTGSENEVEIPLISARFVENSSRRATIVVGHLISSHSTEYNIVPNITDRGSTEYNRSW